MCTNVGGGGGGIQANSAQAKIISPLEGYRENIRQFNAALQAAKDSKAAILEFQDITGKTHRRWYNGATYTDRKPSEANIGGTGKYKRTGIYKAKFTPPKSWGKNFKFE